MASMTTTGTIAKRRKPRGPTIACALLLAFSPPGFGQQDELPMPGPIPDVPLPADKPKLETPEQQEAPTAFAAEEPTPIHGWGVGRGKSYVIPALEIIGFDYFLNRFNYYLVDEEVFTQPGGNIELNLSRKWIIDTDPFAINQFGHPYQGSMYQGFARASGLSFWEAVPYTMFGSALWEVAGENTTPSINDQVTTGVGGNFLGEPLFRLASLLLESSGSQRPGFWRVLGATALSPPVGINRFLFFKKFDGVFPSHDPAVFTRVDLGVILSVHEDSSVNRNRDATGPAIPQDYEENDVSADLTVAYGLPGKPGYTYHRPFDYFAFQFTASVNNIFENIISRGLLYGTDYAVGDNYRGIWGLYGTFDYIAPQVFRVSTTGLGLGTTGQWWLSENVALQGTALATMAYGAGGVIRGDGVGAVDPATGEGERDYHYGVTPQGLLAGRLILGDRLLLDTNLRNYYVSRFGGTEEGTGSENILRAEISATLRIFNLHGLTLKYVETRRDARYDGVGDTKQSVGAFSLVYSLIGQTRFGAVDWRPPSEGGPLK
jgi:hypothetical protein